MWRRPPCTERSLRLIGPLEMPWRKLHNSTCKSVAKNANFAFVEKGGFYSPPKCKGRSKIAVIVPYRNRPEHLQMLLLHLIPVLMRQLLDFRIYIVEQVDRAMFNRGKLINVGFEEALKDSLKWNCFVFHDVDLLLEDDRLSYNCEKSPQHLSVCKLLMYRKH